MKTICSCVALFALSLANAAGQGKTLTTDPLTGLALIPQTDSRLHLGNEPSKLPDTHICKSKVQTDFYVLFDINTNATLAWYTSHLSGFKKVHGFAMSRSQDTFYKPDGTLIVSVTGTPAPDGQDSEAHGVVYMRVEPGLSEKTIASMPQGKVVCP